MKAIGGISGPCEIAYSQWYKRRQKPVRFRGHISDGLSDCVGKSQPAKSYLTERVHIVKTWLKGMEIWSLKRHA